MQSSSATNCRNVRENHSTINTTMAKTVRSVTRRSLVTFSRPCSPSSASADLGFVKLNHRDRCTLVGRSRYFAFVRI